MVGKVVFGNTDCSFGISCDCGFMILLFVISQLLLKEVEIGTKLSGLAFAAMEGPGESAGEKPRCSFYSRRKNSKFINKVWLRLIPT